MTFMYVCKKKIINYNYQFPIGIITVGHAVCVAMSEV